MKLDIFEVLWMNDVVNTIKSDKKETNLYRLNNILTFLIPSLIGLILFIVPVKTEGGVTVPIAILANGISTLIGDNSSILAIILIGLSVVGSIIYALFKPSFIENNEFFRKLFAVNTFWLSARIIGFILVVATYFEIGPEWIYSSATGGMLLYDLIPILISVFFLAGFLLPLLLNFGLLEFFGALLIKVMRPVFTLPGRASLDCLASWVGDGTVGVMLTTKQYEEGYYTKREAAVIATTFSVVSITFSIAILSYLNLEHYFVPYYITIVIAGFVAAIIMPRIPPLSRKADTGYEHVDFKKESVLPKGMSPVKWGFKQALTKASGSKGFVGTMKEGVQNVLDMWLGVLPIVMAIGTIAVIIAEYTPLFTILGKPFEPVLAWMQIPEADVAAQSMIIGFADMFLPAVIGSGIESELTRFVIAGVSVTQLVYMSELGGLLLGSKLPLKITDLIIIFLLRTIITLPIIVIAAHIIF